MQNHKRAIARKSRSAISAAAPAVSPVTPPNFLSQKKTQRTLKAYRQMQATGSRPRRAPCEKAGQKRAAASARAASRTHASDV